MSITNGNGHAATKIRRFNPTEIFPTEGVRINSTHNRDWQQSVASGSESSAHMLRVAPHIEAYYKGLADRFPGAAEIGGGTVPRMDMKIRGEDPYDHISTQRKKLKNTPAMALIRSDAGMGMEETAPDVLEDYLLNYHKAGIDVFRNFHALNDERAHLRVAKSLYKTEAENGTRAHYQAAYSYAVSDKDEAIYNARTPVTFFKKLVALLRKEAQKDGLEQDAYLPHSFVIKDPSGVLDPKMAAEITRQVKMEMAKGGLPNIPFGIHTHNQMGHAADMYKAAVAAGANFIDCGPTPGGYGAQPSMPQMLEYLGGEDGATLGFTSKEAFEAAKKEIAIADKFAEAILKSHDPDVRQNEPDPTVNKHGIAGGQSSLARAEVKGMLQKQRPNDTITRVEVDAFMQKTKEMIPSVRAELGEVCQVTPSADYIFREAARRVAGGNPNKGFYCGHRRVATGEMGPTMEPVDSAILAQALLERMDNRLSRSVSDKNLHAGLRASGALVELRDAMLQFSKPVRRNERLIRVSDRIDEMTELNRQGVTSYDTSKLEQERDELLAMSPKQETLDRYDDFLRIRSDALAKKIESGHKNPLVEYYREVMAQCPKLAAQNLSATENIRLIKTAAYTSVPVAELMPPGLPRAKEELKRLAVDGKYRVPVDAERFQRDAAIGRMVRDPHAASPDGLMGDYLLKRDGLDRTNGHANGNGKPKKGASFTAVATFEYMLDAAPLEEALVNALISADRFDSAANIKVTQKDLNVCEIKLEGIEDPMRFGYNVILDTVKKLGGELPRAQNIRKSGAAQQVA